jgi:putative phosphoribosyl transferase
MKGFEDRAHAGRELAARLGVHEDRDDVVVLGLARGGVPVAAAAGHELRVEFDAFAVRKLGVPWQKELAFGAVASGGVRVLNAEVVRELPLPQEAIEEIAAREARELVLRERAYRGERPPAALEGRTVILVDDGIATGSSMRAAVQAVRSSAPATVLIAVPVAPSETCAALAQEVQRVVCVLTPHPFRAVGVWYEHFDQCTDEEVRRLLAT